MRRTLLRIAPLCTRNLLSPPNCRSFPISPAINVNSTPSKLRFFSSENDSSKESPSVPDTSLTQPERKEVPLNVKDIGNKEFKDLIEKYLKGDEEALSSIMEAIMRRRLAGKHKETDDELIEEFRHQPIDDVKDKDFESDFEELYSTDEEIDNLYNARQYVAKKMMKDEYFNMNDRKWDEMIKEAVEHGHLKDTKECEQILEDILSWDKLLPDGIKQKVEAKFNDLGDMCERGELEPEEAYERFKESEDMMVLECAKMMEKEQPPHFNEITVPDKKKDTNDPPGDGPILRWQTRVVFAPGGDAWHPQNRKVKLSVTVKELGLSKHAFRRLRELVGKRYHPGKDELTITSES